MIASELEKTFTRFLIVGFMLLLLEAIILFFLTSFFGIKPELGRVVSLSVSIILGWYANRSFTFRNRSRLLFRQFFKYYSSMLCGLVINYVAYLSVLNLQIYGHLNIYLGLAFGATAALVFNFLAMKFFVFK